MFSGRISQKKIQGIWQKLNKMSDLYFLGLRVPSIFKNSCYFRYMCNLGQRRVVSIKTLNLRL